MHAFQNLGAWKLRTRFGEKVPFLDFSDRVYELGLIKIHIQNRQEIAVRMSPDALNSVEPKELGCKILILAHVMPTIYV